MAAPDPDDDDEPLTASERPPAPAEVRRHTVPLEAMPPLPTQAGVLTQRPHLLPGHVHYAEFGEEELTETSALGGHAVPQTLEEAEEPEAPEPLSGPVYDGIHPAASVTALDTSRPILAPLQSCSGRRSLRSTLNVMAQFAPGHNPRYLPDAKGASRAHVFVWDVSRAMGCELPHFANGRELSVAQTVDWLRAEGPSRGWQKLALPAALEQVDRGNLAVVVPRDPKRKRVALLWPRDRAGTLRIAAGGPGGGNDVPALEVLGTDDVDAYVHD